MSRWFIFSFSSRMSQSLSEFSEQLQNEWNKQEISVYLHSVLDDLHYYTLFIFNLN